jgi:predicted RNase H-like HicB family nuclease
MLFPIAILPGDDQHAWGVEVPDIPGCFSAGEDLDDAIAMAREAIEGTSNCSPRTARKSPRPAR